MSGLPLNLAAGGEGEHGAGVLFHLGPAPVTEAVFGMWLLMALLAVGLALLVRRFRSVPESRLQVAVESLYEGLVNFYAKTMDEQRARAFAPFLTTLFLFILISNYSGLIPIVPETPWYAAPTSHWGITIGLAVTVFFTVQYMAIRSHGLAHFKHMFEPWYLAWLMFPLGIFEELVKPFSLSLRLYANIFAGETALAQMLHNIPYVLPIAVMALELIAGAIQAFIFTALTTVYLAAATAPEHH